MESIKLQFDWEQSSEAIVFISLGGKGDSFSLVQSLVAEASTRYPQLNQLNFVQVPLPIDKLENWSYYLAAQLIAQWRELSVPKHSVEIIINELGLSNAASGGTFFAALDQTATLTPIRLQLDKRLESLKQRQPNHPSDKIKWLEQEAKSLAEWFTQLPPAPSGSYHSSVEASGCLAQLQSNMLALRSKILRQLEDYFSQMWQVGTRSLLLLLNSLIETFDRIRASFEAQRHDSLRCESSAWRAYYNLRSQLEEHSWRLFGQSSPKWEAVLSALAHAYKFKLEAEIYTQSAQLVGELAQQTRLHADSVEQIDTLFASLQNHYTQRGWVEPLFLPLLKNFLSRVNSAHLRSELENSMGCSFDRWGTLDSTQTTALSEQILDRLRPLCLEVYAECCRCVLNLNPNQQTQPVRTQTPISAQSDVILPEPEKLISLQVQNADIQDVLEMLAKMGKVCVVADRSINGTVSLALDQVPFTEAVNAVTKAGNITYTKNSNIYTFNRVSSKNSPTTIISENSNVYTFNRLSSTDSVISEPSNPSSR